MQIIINEDSVLDTAIMRAIENMTAIDGLGMQMVTVRLLTVDDRIGGAIERLLGASGTEYTRMPAVKQKTGTKPDTRSVVNAKSAASTKPGGRPAQPYNILNGDRAGQVISSDELVTALKYKLIPAGVQLERKGQHFRIADSKRNPERHVLVRVQG